MILVIAEKPSVAQSIAKVLGATSRKDGYMEGGNYIVSWCFGHLVELADASSYDERYAKWRYDDLPIVPENWMFEVTKDKAQQFKVLSALMKDKRVTELVFCEKELGIKFTILHADKTYDDVFHHVITRGPHKGEVRGFAWAGMCAVNRDCKIPPVRKYNAIPGGAKGFFSPVESRIAIQEGMSEIQTVKTAIHEIAHAKLHAVKPDEKAAPEDKKDRHTKEVEAESVAYTVCQRYGIETSGYSFGYIAGWSSGKETKELKSSLDTIRKTAAEMIEGIDAKLKVLLAEKAQSAEMEVEAPVKEVVPEEKPEVPIYRETANYAYEAGEMDAYRASLAANVECRRAIEAAIISNYGDNRLDADAAVKSVLEQFSPECVRYVLANTIQQKDFDGRIPQPLKEWAKTVDVCPENASRFLVDKPNPGLTALFVDAFRQQTEAQKDVTSEKATERDPEVVAWESDEITSIEVKTVEVNSPFAPSPEEAEKAPKAHRLTAEEKEIKAAVMDTLKGQIAYNNDGMRASYRASNHSFNLLARNGVRIEGNTVTQNGEPLFKIHRRHAARKTQGCYRELLPTLEYVKQEQKQEKPSIRDQLKAAAKQQPEKKSPVKSKTHDMEL